jgi:tripartite-type tricarboxylate transporter receptor subunit TctC
MSLRRFLPALLIGFSLAAQAQPAATSPGQAYPNRPVKLIIADGPGSASDLRARQIGGKLAELLGQPVIIENRPGGSMIIGAEAAAKSPADGYTLFFGNITTHSLNPLLIKGLSYQPDDFIPVTLVSAGPLFLVVAADLPARNLDELVALAKTQPGGLSYGAIGQGTPSHIVMEQIKALRGGRFEFIGYKSTPQYVQDMIGGHLKVSLTYWSTIGPQVRAGKLRALAVAAPKRLEVAPDVPTFAEAGMPGIEALGWQGLMVPVGTPGAIVNRLHAEMVKVLGAPEIRAPLVETGAEVGGNTPEEFAAFIRADRERWKKAIAEARIEAN